MLAYWFIIVRTAKWSGRCFKFLCLSFVIRLAEGESLALAPLYLGPLLLRLDECIHNIVQSVGCYYVMTHADKHSANVHLGSALGRSRRRPLSLKLWKWSMWKHMVKLSRNLTIYTNLEL